MRPPALHYFPDHAHPGRPGRAGKCGRCAGRNQGKVRAFQVSGFSLLLLFFSAFLPTAESGDILRGGATASGAGRKSADARANSGADAASLAKVRAQDRLARTTKAISDMRNLQASARAAAGDGGIPDGLAVGGLKVLTGANAKWTGAAAPVQSGGSVTITQNAQQALLHWETFNVGRNTTVNFDQKAGGNDSGKWIAFNKIFDPSGRPSQIRGQIKADGQVYIINQNGIIFGAGSQVNARTLVASSLPVNDRLVEQGLLNNKDAQFLFSSLFVSGGADGTKDFTPPTPLTTDGRNGDVVVEAGATISGPVSADGNGGRVMLVGANVRNEGTISTPSGQTILAAGLQVGVMAHDSTDPSLRGLDVWVGDVGSYGGSVTNSGIIEAYTGSVAMAGKSVLQAGIVDSSTSVSLNGRIDINASYGAVGNPNFDNADKTGGGGPAFLNQQTGSVIFGGASVTRILPDYASAATVPGTSLPENSQINVRGQSIAMLGTSTLLAPHADVTFRAGIWTYRDVDANRTIFKADGTTVEDGLVSNFDGGAQRFFYSGGQVYLDSGSLLDVSGTTDAFVALSQNIMTVQLRGTELADSPGQRDSVIRGQKLVVDLRDSGTYNGTAWVGTPLGDLTSVAGIIQRNVSQLTTSGGTVDMQAGGSIVIQPGSRVDVSGGYTRNEGGLIRKTRLLRNGNLVNIADATPDVTYDGVYDGLTSKTSAKWGITKTYGNSLAPLGGHSDQEYIAGANGGSINLTAPTIIVGGDLVGQTITGPRQLDNPADLASLAFSFQAEARYEATSNDIRFYKTSPAAPVVRVTGDSPSTSGQLLATGETLPESLTSKFEVSTSWWSSEGGGFGHVMVDNRDGDLLLPAGVDVLIPAGGSFAARASNITIGGTITAPGGSVELTAYNFSPYEYQKLEKTDKLINEPARDPQSGRGVITLAGSASINVAGMLIDDRLSSKEVVADRRVLDGGSVSLEGYSVNLAAGSRIDASGGALAKAVKGFEYGSGGKISILAGRDPDLSTIIGGTLAMNGTLAAYSATTGGSLAIRANLIQIGGQSSDSTMLALAPEFFRTGGFTSYSLTGIGKSTKPALTAAQKKDALANPVAAPVLAAGEDPKEDTYIPAIRIVEGTVIEPVAEQWQIQPPHKTGGKLTLKPMLKSEGERKPVSLKLAATGADDSFTTEFVEARGDIVIEKGSVIRTDAGASVLIGTDSTLTKTLADTVTMDGTIIAPGGTVAIFTRGEFRLAADAKANRTYALPTIYIGPNAVISTAGKVVSTPDAFGRRTGVLYSGGTISIHGNIVAEAGAVLDVSGASGIFDIHPSHFAKAGEKAVPVTSGLNSLPYSRQTVETRVDSNGGLLELHGSEMLFTDATLLGRAGGPTATGGTLSIFSGRYYPPGASRTSADINLVVTQGDLALQNAAAKRGVGSRVKYAGDGVRNLVKYSDGDSIPAMGYFAANSFQQGGFASLDLGYKFLEDASPISYGGNIEFVGPVSISASGSLRVAGGGIIRADSPVNLTASYIAVGQAYRQPVNPADSAYVAFKQDPPDAVAGVVYSPQPTYGTGSVHFNAPLIDIGTTVFEKTGKVTFTAADGDIRGDGTLSVAGDITLTAGQVYPATLATFNIFAYDHAAGKGSVTIKGSGSRPIPYSAGGSLNIFASTITQGGTLRAPFGSISLGWDGTDFDLSTAAFDSPINPAAGKGLAVPTAQSVVLGAGSVTSVSAVDPATGEGIIIPFGMSPDGLSWIDPRGVNVTVNGLPQKRISIAGNSVTTESGSVIDIRGGGDLLAYRWVSGTGGSQDLLGETAGDWGEGTSYEAGDLVTYKGKTWSARRSIDPEDFLDSAAGSAKKSYAKSKDLTANPKDVAPTPPSPETGIYWTEVKDSYAIVPGYAAGYAPRAAYNTGSSAEVLGGDPGYTSATLGLGDQMTIDGVDGAPGEKGLAAGTYTLLPRRYALLPGAFLVTPQSGGTFSSFSTKSDALTTGGVRITGSSSGTFARYNTLEGASLTSGSRLNPLNAPSRLARMLSLFEVAPPKVLADRAEYEVYGANEFMASAAKRLDVNVVQRLPIDSGHLSFQGNSALQLEGSVLTSHPFGGRGASVDISSDAEMHVVGGAGSAPPGARVVLSSDLLSSWGAESLLIGGLRRTTEDGTVVDVRTSSLTVNNPGTTLSSPEITLVSKSVLAVTSDSAIDSIGNMTQQSEMFFIAGDGTLLRVSGDKYTSVFRSALAGSTSPLMTIGSGAKISGAGVILDSTYGTSLSSNALLTASYLTLSSGQISLDLDGSSGGLAGAVVVPHLTLQGGLLQRVQQVESLTLASYRTIDIYGSGTFGAPTLGSLKLFASGIRGYNRGAVTLSAQDVTMGNPSNSIALPAPAAPLTGSLNIEAGTMRLGENAFSVAGYQSLNISAKNGLLTAGTGSLTLPGSFTVTAPLITGSKGTSYQVTAAGAVSLLRGGESAGISGGLGASLGFTGSSVVANSTIRLLSGGLTLRATGGSVTVGGNIDTSGSSQSFFDITRYADAGNIRLISDAGSVILGSGSTLNVSAHPGGGDAGTIEIRSGFGTFVNDGTLLGSASAGSTGGSFLLDTGAILSFANINNPLETGGFTEERNFRIRTGNILIDGSAHARNFSLSADAGNITLTGAAHLDASGATGGSIALAARDNVTVQSGALLTVAAQKFSSAGKGGSIRIEAGAQSDGTVNTSALLDLQAGSTINLSVAEFKIGDQIKGNPALELAEPNGRYTDPTSSAFYGQFQGTLHLRAPRLGNDVRVDSIESAIQGGSSVVVEAYRLYDRTATGTLDTALRGTINTDATTFMNAGEAAMRTKLLTGNPGAAALASVLVIAPGVEIISRTGDLALGLANPTGSTNAQSLSSADWDLSTFRYGTKSAPGILTLRAKGDLIFNNTLSDGFTPVTASTVNGNSNMWLATLKTIVASLPVNTQSWSFRLTSGADLGAADFRLVLPIGSLAAGQGSVLVGEFYPAVPNSLDTGTAAAIGTSGLTANSIRISTDTTNRGTRFEVIRTGTGDITINAGRDVQLRNQFSTIYTAGVALPSPDTISIVAGVAQPTLATIFQTDDFVVPVLPTRLNRHPSQSGSEGVTLGAIQQLYFPKWSMAGGDVTISAQNNIGHYTIYNGPITDNLTPGDMIRDSSRQMPTNWLFRRGYVDSSTGLFASGGGVDPGDDELPIAVVTDITTSTTWWVDFSNFFAGVGALGGGNITLVAGNDIVNIDAVSPTNARMAGRDPVTGLNLAPDMANMLELGGGDITVRAGNNIDGGVYYVERGTGTLFAGGSITTNSARSSQLGILDASSTTVNDSATWLPTTLMVGKAYFDVSALSDVLLGPVTNPFLLPQGLNNKFWYKTYFNTFSSDAGVEVSSFGGSVTHRTVSTLPGAASATSILGNWFGTQNLFAGAGSANNASHYQPWLRLSEVDISSFSEALNLGAPNLKSSAFSGDVNIVGPMTLFPSSRGTLELVASGSIAGLQPTGEGAIPDSDNPGQTKTVKVWTASSVNVSDADPSLLVPGIISPIAYQSFVGRVSAAAKLSKINPYSQFNDALQESGSYSGEKSSIEIKRGLHAEGLLHKGDSSPVRLYATGGSITGMTLFTPKVTRVIAKKDITDIAFYIQNVSADDVSIVSAGRDVIPYNENSPQRSLAANEAKGNYIGDAMDRTSTGVLSNTLAGDLQINGPGYLEVLAGRNLDLGTGPNYTDGTGVGITSIGNFRNPFLPFEGASIIAMAGVQGISGGAALGLAGSNLDFQKISIEGAVKKTYASKELEYINTLDTFFGLLQQAGTESETTGSYETGFTAIDELFGDVTGSGEIFTRARDIRTSTGGEITIAAPSGGLTMASDIYGNPDTPPGIVTEYGGKVSIFTDGSVDIGRTRIFTLRGGDMTIWSSTGDIAAGTAPQTVVTAPPTRVVIDATSADISTDLGGLATGGGIGVLASVEGIAPANVYLIAPVGTVDAGDAGIQATGDIKIAAAAVLNADNISAGGTSTGVPSAPVVAAPNIGGLTSGSSSTAAASSAANSVSNQSTQKQEVLETPSTITVEVLGYGGGEEEG
ncbi:MAG: filamentous hemagglutinin family protein [Terrimicrobiaceae bacterium]